MTTTTRPETLAQEYRRLMDKRNSILPGFYDPITPAHEELLRPVNARLFEILAIPSPGYELPKAVADLKAFADAHGWITQIQWTPPDWQDEVYVVLHLAHKLTEDEARDHRSNLYLYKLTWHSRDCAPGKVKKFGAGLAKTPDHPQWGGAPSVKEIRAIIEQHSDAEAIFTLT